MAPKYEILFITLQLFLPTTKSNSEKPKIASRTDLDHCKVSQFGTEYRGRTHETAGGIRCQSWHGEGQIHDVDPSINDGDFPERSMRLAKNYCRNPTGDPKGPWCYTMEPSLIDDECGVPLCNFGECRITGGGAEYGGSREISSSGKKCKSWNKRHKTVKGSTEKFSNRDFPDSSKRKAKHYCRNPDDDPGGPWCYVEEENYELVEREYCDIPFCDDRDCLVYTRNASTYSTITSMNSTAGNMTVWVKLWEPKDELKGEARLLLTLLPIPTSPKIIADDWRAGTELLISNSGSGQRHPGFTGDGDLEPTPNILLSSNWTGLSITWGGGFISVSLQGSVKPIFLDEYGKKNTISSHHENSFFYYGLTGTGVLWSTDYCLQSCEIHTTYGTDFIRVWPFQQSNTTYDINFQVRASKKVLLKLYESPGKVYPCFTITFENSQLVTLTYQESSKSVKQQLQEVSSSNLLDFWTWKHFTLSTFGPHLRLFSEKHYGNEEILYAKEHVFSTLRWFSVGSENSIAHWALFCTPGEEDVVEKPSPPNCLSNPRDYLYQGSQWISQEGRPCIPWSSKDIPEEDRKNSLFPEGSLLGASNKCRNPGHDPKGPYCYTSSSSGLEKNYCSIRACRSSECRTAGTANDYIGALSVTRSGRTCAPWVIDEDGGQLIKPAGRQIPEKTPSTLAAKTGRQSLVEKLKEPKSGEDVLSYDKAGARVLNNEFVTVDHDSRKCKPKREISEEDKNKVLAKMDKLADEFYGRTRPSTEKPTEKSVVDEGNDEDDVLVTLPKHPHDVPERKSSSSTEKATSSTAKSTHHDKEEEKKKVLEKMDKLADEFFGRTRTSSTEKPTERYHPTDEDENYDEDNVLITMPKYPHNLPEGKSSSTTKKSTSSKPNTTEQYHVVGENEDYDEDNMLITMPKYSHDVPEGKSSSSMEKATSSTAKSTHHDKEEEKKKVLEKMDKLADEFFGRTRTSSTEKPTERYHPTDEDENYDEDNVLITMPKYPHNLPEGKSSSTTKKSTSSKPNTTEQYHVVGENEDYDEDNMLITMPKYSHDVPEGKSSSSMEKATSSTAKSTHHDKEEEKKKVLEKMDKLADEFFGRTRTSSTEKPTERYHPTDEDENYDEDNVLITMPKYSHDLPEGKSSSTTKKSTSSKPNTTEQYHVVGENEDYDEDNVLITMPKYPHHLSSEEPSSSTEKTAPSTEKTTSTTETSSERHHEAEEENDEDNVLITMPKYPPDLSPSTEKPTPSPKNERPRRPNDGIIREHFNETLFPEQSARNASNYCRDPSRNIAGAWCYTTDPEVPQDLCDVPDCDESDECISLVRGQETKRKFFVFPEHRSEGLRFSLKAWEPDNPDSITFTFTADEGLKSRYILKVGAMDNEKVLLYRQGEEGGVELVKKKTLPHLLYLGKWSSFIIKIPRGKIQIFYEESPNALFEWEDPDPAQAFLPVYYSYASELGNTIGVSFGCLSRCLVENTQTERFTRIIPIKSSTQRIELMIRAEGVVLVPLLLFPATPGYYAVTLGELDEWIFFIKNTYPNVQIYHKQKAPHRVFTKDTWTNITIIWYNSTIDVYWNETLTFNYVHIHPLLFYFFSLGVDKGGWATWTANCLPPDIDGDPIDGGWSEWSPWACSASCNGGVGTRKRYCNNPEPNIKGEPCMGPSVMTGKCNTILCGDITEDTVNLIKRRARLNHTSIIIKEGQSVIIPSDADAIEIITRESPDSDINWSHNGIFLNPDEERVQLVDHDIVIKRSEVNDSGVYTITLHRVDETHMILKLVSLAVLPVRNIVTLRETLPMTAVCHCVIIGYLYNDLKVSWSINNKMWKDYGTTQPISVNVDLVPALNGTHRGMWRCVVRQDDLGFNWTTNAIFVNVIGPPNWKTHLMEDRLTRPIFGWMPSEGFVAASALIIFLVITLCIIAGTIVYLRFQKSLEGAMSPGVTRRPRTAERVKPHQGKEKISTRKKVFDQFQKLSDRKKKRPEREKLLSSDE